MNYRKSVLTHSVVVNVEYTEYFGDSNPNAGCPPSGGYLLGPTLSWICPPVPHLLRAHISTTTDKQLACSSDSPLQGVRRIQPATAEDTAGTSYTYPAQAVTDGGAPTAIGEHTHWRGQGETSQNESPSSRKTESSPQYTTNSPLAMVGGNVYACSLLSRSRVNLAR